MRIVSYRPNTPLVLSALSALSSDMAVSALSIDIAHINTVLGSAALSAAGRETIMNGQFANLVSRVGTLASLQLAETVTVIGTFAEGPWSSDQRDSLARALMDRVAQSSSTAAVPQSAARCQRLMSWYNYMTPRDHEVLADPATSDYIKCATIKQRLVSIGCVSLSERTYEHVVRVSVQMCETRRTPVDMYGFLTELKRLMEPVHAPHRSHHINQYPDEPKDLPQAVFDHAYTSGDPVPATLAWHDHIEVPLRGSNKHVRQAVCSPRGSSSQSGVMQPMNFDMQHGMRAFAQLMQTMTGANITMMPQRGNRMDQYHDSHDDGMSALARPSARRSNSFRDASPPRANVARALTDASPDDGVLVATPCRAAATASANAADTDAAREAGAAAASEFDSLMSMVSSLQAHATPACVGTAPAKAKATAKATTSKGKGKAASTTKGGKACGKASSTGVKASGKASSKGGKAIGKTTTKGGAASGKAAGKSGKASGKAAGKGKGGRGGKATKGGKGGTGGKGKHAALVLGCSKCRYAPKGCAQCKNPLFFGQRGPA